MRRSHRSFFWPVVLIGVGLIWFLSNMKIIPEVNLGVLLRMWPALLIVIGIDILVGRRSALISALVGIVVVALITLVLVKGSVLGMELPKGVQNQVFREPLGNATSAGILLDLSSERAEVNALNDSTDLVYADLTYSGEVEFKVSGTQRKSISLRKSFSSLNWFTPLSLSDRNWKIGLSPRIALDLSIDGGSGKAVLNLQNVQLASLDVATGSGEVQATLPASQTAYTASFESGSGRVLIGLPLDTGLTLRLDGGSGGIEVTLPAAAAVRLEVLDSGSGSVKVPASLLEVEHGKNDEGAWETVNFVSASRRLLIQVVGLGSGSVRLIMK
jgi:hypothetical protein